jgi:hypothetical protein
MAQDLGRSSKRQGAHDTEGLQRESHCKKILLDDAYLRMIAEPLPQPRGPLGIGLDRDDAHTAARQGVRDRAETGTDLNNQFAPRKGHLIDQVIGSCGVKKILAEQAPPPVSGCPPAGGHGRSP